MCSGQQVVPGLPWYEKLVPTQKSQQEITILKIYLYVLLPDRWLAQPDHKAAGTENRGT